MCLRKIFALVILLVVPVLSLLVGVDVCTFCAIGVGRDCIILFLSVRSSAFWWCSCF